MACREEYPPQEPYVRFIPLLNKLQGLRGQANKPLTCSAFPCEASSALLTNCSHPPLCAMACWAGNLQVTDLTLPETLPGICLAESQAKCHTKRCRSMTCRCSSWNICRSLTCPEWPGEITDSYSCLMPPIPMALKQSNQFGGHQRSKELNRDTLFVNNTAWYTGDTHHRLAEIP